jgi:hypothetical protein
MPDEVAEHVTPPEEPPEEAVLVWSLTGAADEPEDPEALASLVAAGLACRGR